MRFPFAAIVLVALCASTALGQPLADRVPIDAKVYIGWAGSQHLGEAYAVSHLKAVIDSSGFEQLILETIDSAFNRMRPGDEREVFQGMARAAAVMLRHPTAIYLTGINPDPAGDESPFDVAILCQSGGDTAAIAEHLAPLIRVLREENAPFAVDIGEGIVAVSLGQPTVHLDAGAKGRLQGSDRFTMAIAQTAVAQPLLCAYADVNAIVGMIDTVIRETEGPRGHEQWTRLREALNLDGLHGAAFAAGFDGPDWSNGLFIHAPAPRKGITKLFEAGEPIAADTLRLIPATAGVAGMDTVDLAQLYDTLYNAITQMEPRAAEDIEEGLRQFEQQFAFHPRDDLLASLGPQWAWFTDRTVAGSGLAGIVLVNPLRDARKVESCLTKLFLIANVIMAQEMEHEDMKLSIRTVERNGTVMHYLSSPVLTPTVAVHDGRLYVGLVPHAVMGAINLHKNPGQSILDNANFTKLRGALGGERAASFSYVDIPQNLPSTYPLLAMGDRFLTGMMEMAGLDAPAMLLPPLHVLIEQAGPAASFAWSDGQGLHVRSKMPFPGAPVLGMGQDMNLTMAAPVLVGGVALPALGRAREQADRTVSAAQLSNLYKAIFTYSVIHDDDFPPDLALLVEDGSIGPRSLFHPGSGKRVPVEVQREGLKAIARWAADNSDYVYIEGLTANTPADGIVLYEKLDQPWTREGINIVWGDGHVEWQEIHRARRTLRDAGIGFAVAKPADDDGGKDEPIGPGKAYYLDTKTEKVFTDDAALFPPIVSPDGNEAVRVHFFSCGNCKDRNNRFIGFYEKYTAEAKKQLESANPEEIMMEMYDMGVLYSIDGKTWHDPASEAYQDGLQRKLSCPDGTRPRYCRAR